MNKLLMGSSIDYYQKHDTNKMEENNSSMYTDGSFYPAPTSFPLANSPESYETNKRPLPLSSATALCAVNPSVLMASSQPTTTVPAAKPPSELNTSSSTQLLEDMIKTNDSSPFYPDFYTTINSQQQDLQQQHQLQHHNLNHQHQHQHFQQQHQHQHQQDLSHQHQRKKQRRQISSSPAVSSISTSVPLSAPTPSSILASSFTDTHSSSTIKSTSASSGVVQSSISLTAPSSSAKTTTTTILAPPTSAAGLNMTLVLSQEKNQDRELSVSPSTSPNTTTQILENNNTNISNNGSNNNTTEIRRQIHIQSEQKRRAQIKCGFEELRNELPTCLNKKMSKVALLHRTVQHIQHLKSTQITILAELERLVQENEQLKRFQQSVLQNQVMDSIYPIQ